LERSVFIEDGELLECAWPEIAQVVNIVALQQRHDAATLGRAHWNLQQQVTALERLVVDRQGRLVVAEPLSGVGPPGFPEAVPLDASQVKDQVRLDSGAGQGRGRWSRRARVTVAVHR
jgi:hypothetical protein